MKDFLEFVSSYVFLASLLALIFVFQGDPDLWDKWHAAAMASAECGK